MKIEKVVVCAEKNCAKLKRYALIEKEKVNHPLQMLCLGDASFIKRLLCVEKAIAGTALLEKEKVSGCNQELLPGKVGMAQDASKWH